LWVQQRQFQAVGERLSGGEAYAIRYKEANALIICDIWSELVDRIEIFDEIWMVKNVSSRAVYLILNRSSNFARRKGVWMSNDPIPTKERWVENGKLNQ
jgi:hypothetical protein